MDSRSMLRQSKPTWRPLTWASSPAIAMAGSCAPAPSGSLTRQGMPGWTAAPAGSCSSTPLSEMSTTWQLSCAWVVNSSAPAAKATRANWRRSVLMMVSRGGRRRGPMLDERLQLGAAAEHGAVVDGLLQPLGGQRGQAHGFEHEPGGTQEGDGFFAHAIGGAGRRVPVPTGLLAGCDDGGPMGPRNARQQLARIDRGRGHVDQAHQVAQLLLGRSREQPRRMIGAACQIQTGGEVDVFECSRQPLKVGVGGHGCRV
mmetsp:Transcript_6969/g.29488  ORF Transcript_6969/g.29488 Transcript_6969/m.29488 type:complete len:257 (+) Transcript_6969:352-1122(+)